MTQFLKIALLSLSVVFSQISHSEIVPGGTGLLYGSDHAFNFTAPKGWVLDNQSGVNQGLHMVFYPAGLSWQNAHIIMYGRAAPIKHVPSIDFLIEDTINGFRKNGSPNYQAATKSDIPLKNGNIAKVVHYSGDQWGNYEAVAYIKEANTINFLVYNARNKESFKTHLPSFEKTVAGYKNRYISPIATNKEKMQELISRANQFSEDPKRKAYKTEALKKAGPTNANAFSSCMSYEKDKSPTEFHYVANINKAGEVVEHYVAPSNTLTVCYAGLMAPFPYPESEFDENLLHIDIKIK